MRALLGINEINVRFLLMFRNNHTMGATRLDREHSLLNGEVIFAVNILDEGRRVPK